MGAIGWALAWAAVAVGADGIDVTGVVLHEGDLDANRALWSTTWVDVPPADVTLASPLPAGTTAWPPTTEASLVRDRSGRVIRLVNLGWRVSLQLPRQTESPVAIPLWDTDAIQRVVVHGARFVPDGDADAVAHDGIWFVGDVDAQVQRPVERAGGSVPPDAEVLIVKVDRTTRGIGLPGTLRLPPRIPAAVWWIVVAAAVAVLGGAFGLRPRRSRRRFLTR